MAKKSENHISETTRALSANRRIPIVSAKQIVIKIPVKKLSRRGIQSIEIGFGILNVLCKANGPIPLRIIAEKAHMPVANVHNYLVSFQNVGVVVQESDTGFYGLGNYAITLGIAALQQFDVQKVARPIMAEIGALTGHSVFLGVWGNKGPTVVYRVECAKNPPLMEMRVGSVLPLLTSALGRNFLSHLPGQLTSTLVKEELAKQKSGPELSPKADIPRSLDQVLALASKIRANGFSTCVDSLVSGYTSLSAPVFDQFGGIIACLTVMGPSNKIKDDTNTETIHLLKKYSAEISKAAGWQKQTHTESK